MVADDIATANGMNSNLFSRTLTDDAGAPVTDGFVHLLSSNFGEDLPKRPGGPAGRIPLEPMVHFDNFQIITPSQNLGGLSRQPQQRVDTHGTSLREADSNFLFEISDLRTSFVLV